MPPTAIRTRPEPETDGSTRARRDPARMSRVGERRRRRLVNVLTAAIVVTGVAQVSAISLRAESPARARSAPIESPTPNPGAPPAGATPVVGSCGARGVPEVRFRVSVQRDLPARFSETRDGFAAGLLGVLCDGRSWVASRRVAFRYDPTAPLVIKLLDAARTERRCMQLIGLSVGHRFSCADRQRNEVVLNAQRWFHGSTTWRGTVRDYRHLLVNHEIGHILGQRHVGCPKKGAPAPVMMQQSKGTGGCLPNAWPTAAELRALAARYPARG